MISVGFANPIQITGEGADCRCDRHLVIVEHYNQARLQMTSLVDSFHRHAAGQRRIADQRNDVVVFALAIARDRHSQRR